MRFSALALMLIAFALLTSPASASVRDDPKSDFFSNSKRVQRLENGSILVCTLPDATAAQYALETGVSFLSVLNSVRKLCAVYPSRSLRIVTISLTTVEFKLNDMRFVARVVQVAVPNGGYGYTLKVSPAD